MSDVVLDASALLALLRGEPGSEVVDACLEQAAMSAVNLAEVVAVLARHGLSEADIRSIVEGLPITVVAFDDGHALPTGLWKKAPGTAGLSLGDRACLATARALGLPALTGDRAWSKAKVGVAMRFIR